MKVSAKIDERDEDLRLLRVSQVLELIPMSRSSPYRSIESGEFPAPVKLNAVSFWVNSEIRKWLHERCHARRRENEDLI